MFILGGALTNREVLAVICTPMHFNLTCSLSCEHVLYMFYKLIVIAIDLFDCSARNGGDRWKSGQSEYTPADNSCIIKNYRIIRA